MLFVEGVRFFVDVAKKLNPEIKIYQMTIDLEAFKLKEKEI